MLSSIVAMAMGCGDSPAPARVAAMSASPFPSVSSVVSAALAVSALPTKRDHEEPTTMGDVTCTNDGDCVVSNKAECCECCASSPRATSRAWLEWRDREQCPGTRCEPCGKVKCPFYGDPVTFHAVCEHEKCALTRFVGQGF